MILQDNYIIQRMISYSQQPYIIESSYRQQFPFFRQAISLIDQCKKLMRNDRLYLRNKLKQYSKNLRQNKVKDYEEDDEEIKEIMKIFVEADKKRSLNKIIYDERIMHWLQIRLRKFVDRTRKEKHKHEIDAFRKNSKNSHFIKVNSPNTDQYVSSRMHSHSKSKGKYNERSYRYPTRKGSTSRKNYNKNQILTQREDVIHRIMGSEGNSENSYSYDKHSYYKKFPFKGRNKQNHKYEDNFTDRIKNEKKIHQNYYQSDQKQNGHYSNMISNSKSNNSRSANKSQSKYYNPSVYQQEHSVKEEFSKLSQMLSQQLNYSDSKKVQHPSIFINEGSYEQKQKQKQWQPFINEINTSKNYSAIQHHNAHNSSRGSEEYPINNQSQSPPHSNQVNESSEKIKYMLENSRNFIDNYKDKKIIHYDHSPKKPSPTAVTNFQNTFNKFPIPNIKFTYQNSAQKKQQLRDSREIHRVQVISQQPKVQPLSAFQNTVLVPRQSNNIFTPPELLAECRKFVTNSSKKQGEQQVVSSQVKGFESYAQSPSFNSNFNSSKQMQQKIDNLFHNSASSKKPSKLLNSLNFNRITNLQDLLAIIFSDCSFVDISKQELDALMEKVESEAPQIKLLFLNYINFLKIYQELSQHKSITVCFIDTIKYFCDNCKQFNKKLLSLFSYTLNIILDIQKNEKILKADVYNFLQSLSSSEIESQTLVSIELLLIKVFEKAASIEQNEENQDFMTRWSLYYLEVMKDRDLQKLEGELQPFEFQIEAQQV